MDRQILNFTANEQTLICDNPIRISTNKVNYIEAHFSLGTNWSGYDSVRAVWFNDYQTISTVLDSQGVCRVPFEVMKRKGQVKVDLVGSISEGDVLTDRLTSYPVVAVIVDCVAPITGAETSPITPSQFEQFVANVRADADRAEAGAEAAETSADEANASATASAQSATASANSASQAQTYAQNAQNYAASAETAKDDAIDAKEDAESAKADAESARDQILGMRATANTLAEGSDATASYSDGVLTLGIPRGNTGAKGDKGDKGDTGATPNLSIGTVETLPPTGQSQVTITGTAENPVLNFKLVKGDTGEVTQAEFDEAVTDLKSDLKKWNRLDDVSIKDGTNLIPTVTEKGIGGYQSTNGVISEVTASGYAYMKFPIEEKTAYFCNDSYRWMFTVDSNGIVVNEVNAASKTIVVGAGAVECCITYHETNHPITAVSKIAIPSETDSIYELPAEISSKEFVKGNLFSDCGLLGENIYVSVTSGKLTTNANSAYNSYILPVDGISKYAFTLARFAVPLSYDRDTALVVSELSNVTIIDTSDYSGCEYVAFSVNKNSIPLTKFIVSKGEYLNVIDTYPNWTGGNLAVDIAKNIADIYPYKTAFTSISADSLTSGQNIMFPNTMSELRKGERVVLEADFSSFTSIEIGLNDIVGTINNTHKHFFFVIDNTYVSFYRLSSATAYSIAHGLTMTDNIQIILEYESGHVLKLTIISDGEVFTNTYNQMVKSKCGVYYALAGSAFTNVKMAWTCTDIAKKVWLFGDSYLGFGTTRWLYYLAEHGYDHNCLINSYPGEASAQDIVSLKSLLAFGTPKFAVWCAGMNDGADSGGTPSSAWMSAITEFIRICRSNNITPILATIPTVPSINNEYKNAWVRSSGYRYIDFAKAVGAQANGTWFSGMLSSDNVHPTEQGAKALFARALLDLPELMLEF